MQGLGEMRKSLNWLFFFKGKHLDNLLTCKVMMLVSCLNDLG
jgi:hypothetical protein